MKSFLQIGIFLRYNYRHFWAKQQYNISNNISITQLFNQIDIRLNIMLVALSSCDTYSTSSNLTIFYRNNTPEESGPSISASVECDVKPIKREKTDFNSDSELKVELET